MIDVSTGTAGADRGAAAVAAARYIRSLADVRRGDVALVGGKNAGLGELIHGLSDAGVRVPEGFATTADAYRHFVDRAGLRATIDGHLARVADGAPAAEAGAAIRAAILDAPIPDDLRVAITTAYGDLCRAAGYATDDLPVAVRSSATAEDLPEASFAGQLESFLDTRGPDAVVAAVHRCYASLYTDRAISYREHHGFTGADLAVSAGVQRMVRSDLAGAGVTFTLDPETGFPGVLVIDAAFGLGEIVVSGKTDPDEYVVAKPQLDDPALRPVLSRRAGRKEAKIVRAPGGGTRRVETDPAERARLVLDDDEILTLARWGLAVERHFGVPMDIEWAKDGPDGELFLVQARPETVQSRRGTAHLRSYRLLEHGTPLVTGAAVGEAVTTGRVCLLRDARHIAEFEPGSVLVTEITDPDWEPVMKRAAAIVTDHGGRTSHAAIISRELGLPAIVGTGDATRVLRPGQQVTVSCAEGDLGRVYDGALSFEERDIDLAAEKPTRTKVMLNLADPSAALRWWRLPADGVGLARMEFVVNNHIGVHPLALLHPERLGEADRAEVRRVTEGFAEPAEFFVDRLAQGIARIAAAWYPRPVVVRLSDFKTNEYARLLGGAPFEPAEANPMIGWRGASRYYDPGYREGFALECRALERVRGPMGLTNVVVMVPFCRTLGEADRVLATMAEDGLVRGRDGLKVYVMAEIPANIVLAAEFAERFDGFSIGSNDLTQLTLGIDRDSTLLARLFDERDPAVTRSIEHLIEVAHRSGRPVGLCGQRPSDDPAFARFLVEAGIDSISVAPDSFVAVRRNVAAAEGGSG